MPLTSILLLTGKAFGQVEEKEPAAIVEIGGAGQWAFNHGKPSYGPNFAVEVTPIKEWLEIEAGVTPSSLAMVRRNGTQTFSSRNRTRYLKPRNSWLGLAPNGRTPTAAARGTNSIAAEAALDFMFWPATEAKVRLVSGAELRIQLRQRSSAVHKRLRRTTHSNPIEIS